MKIFPEIHESKKNPFPAMKILSLILLIEFLSKY